MQKYRVPSVERAFRIMDEIGLASQGLSLMQLTERTGLPKTTIFMLLTVLERIGALRQTKGQFYLGGHLATLGGQALQQLDLRVVAEPVMQSLSDRTGFTVHLGVLERGQVIFVGKIEHEGFIRFSSYVGLAQPFHVSSLGKAIAAFLPPDEIEPMLQRPLGRRTRYTITEPETLRRALEVVRSQGYAIEDEEDEEGVRCIGAPVFDHAGHVVAAVSITAVRADLPVEAFSDFSREVITAAREISQLLGSSVSNTGSELGGRSRAQPKPTEVVLTQYSSTEDKG